MFALFALVTTTLASISQIITSYSYSGDGLLGFFMVLGLGLTFYLTYLVIRKTDAIIDVLGLDKGFENDRIPFDKMNSRVLIQTGCILIGGIVFFGGIDDFVVELYSLFTFQANNSIVDSLFGNESRYSIAGFVQSCIELAVGYLVFTISHRLADWLKPVEE